MVFGPGVAGLCCAKILARQGWEVDVWGNLSRASPILILNSVTYGLLGDIWQVGNDLWDGAHRLEERRIIWGAHGTLTRVREPSVVIRGDRLAERLLEYLMSDHAGQVHLAPFPGDTPRIEAGAFQRAHQEFDWVLDASGRGAYVASILGAARRRVFGRRHVISVEVELAPACEQLAYWIESVPDGWVLLAPLGNGTGLMQAMVPTLPEDTRATLTEWLEQTCLIGGGVTEVSARVSVFEAAPQQSAPLCGAGWIAVGDAAISLDPVCGDGTGYAVRSAILAASVTEGMAAGLPRDDCLGHYAFRLSRTFAAHLEACRQYYSAAFTSSAWQAEIERMHASLPVDGPHDNAMARTKYRLQGFRLTPTQDLRGQTQKTSHHPSRPLP